MKNSDICECLAVHGIENVFYGEWKHEGYICGCSSQHINFTLDGKEYVMVLHEVSEGQHWSEFLGGQ